MTQDDFLAQWKKVFDAGVIDQAAFEAATKGIAGQLAGAVAIAQGEGPTSVAPCAMAIRGNNAAAIKTDKSTSRGGRIVQAEKGPASLSALA